jgi:hypothetical protein
LTHVTSVLRAPHLVQKYAASTGAETAATGAEGRVVAEGAMDGTAAVALPPLGGVTTVGGVANGLDAVKKGFVLASSADSRGPVEGDVAVTAGGFGCIAPEDPCSDPNDGLAAGGPFAAPSPAVVVVAADAPRTGSAALKEGARVARTVPHLTHTLFVLRVPHLVQKYAGT